MPQVTDLVIQPAEEFVTPIVAVNAADMARFADLTRRGRAIEVSDDVTFERADKLNAEARWFLKGLEKSRVEIKRPYLECGRAIDAAHKEAAAPLREVTDRLSQDVLAYQRAREREANEQRARVAREAAEAARKEAQRKQDELKAIADGKPREVVPPPPPIVRPTPMPLPPPVAKSVTTRRAKTLQIDETRLPHAITIGGVEVPLWIPDTATIKRLLKDPQQRIPGASYVEAPDSVVSRRGG